MCLRLFKKTLHNEIKIFWHKSKIEICAVVHFWGKKMFTAKLLDEAKKFMHHMLTKVVEYGGSDLFITADFQPSIKHQGLMKPFGQQELTAEKTKLFAYS